MSEFGSFDLPDAFTLYEWVETVPLESELGYWECEFSDPYDMKVRLTFNYFERYFQVVLKSKDEPVYSNSQSGVWSLYQLLSPPKTALRAESRTKDFITEVDIVVKPRISVSWRSMVPY